MRENLFPPPPPSPSLSVLGTQKEFERSAKTLAKNAAHRSMSQKDVSVEELPLEMLCGPCQERSRSLKRFAPYANCGTCRIGSRYCKCGNSAKSCLNCAPRCEHGFVQGTNCVTCNPAHFCACGQIKGSHKATKACNFAEMEKAPKFMPTKEMKKAPKSFNRAGERQRYLCPECSFEDWKGGQAGHVRKHVLRHHPEYPGAAEYLALHPYNQVLIRPSAPTTRPGINGSYR
jgi:hypothetical protein